MFFSTTLSVDAVGDSFEMIMSFEFGRLGLDGTHVVHDVIVELFKLIGVLITL